MQSSLERWQRTPLLEHRRKPALLGRACCATARTLPKPREAVTADTFHYNLNRKKLRERRRREGRYLLRSNLCEAPPDKLWQLYMQLCHVEEAFRDLKGDLGIRPIYHKNEERIEAHIFVAFLAYSVQVTLRNRLKAHAPGWTPRSVIEKMAALQMLDVAFPTTDNRRITFARYTQPETDHKLILEKLNLKLPPQRPPRITSKGEIISP